MNWKEFEIDHCIKVLYYHLPGLMKPTEKPGTERPASQQRFETRSSQTSLKLAYQPTSATSKRICSVDMKPYLVFLLSLAALPANSKTSAAKYSITAAR